MKLFRFFSAILLLASCNAQTQAPKLQTNKDDNSLLWEVSGNGLKQPSYLFGTFHLMCKDDIHLGEQLRKAINASDEMYLEMDMDDPALLLGGMLLMNMKEGKQLKDFYTEEEYRKIESFFADTLGTPIGMLQRMKPMLLESLLYPKMMACKTMSGVEEELMKLAKDGKKEIKGLETMEFQAAVFDSIPYDEQAKELLKTIDSLPQYRKYFDVMLSVYKNQQLTQMETLFNKTEFGMVEHNDILLDNRNKNWVAQLKVIMKAKAVFVAVGAGHLPGKMGVIALLKQEGFTVRPLLNK